MSNKFTLRSILLFQIIAVSLAAKASSFSKIEVPSQPITMPATSQNSVSSLQIFCPADQVFATGNANCLANFGLPNAQTVNSGCSGVVSMTYTSAFGNGVGPFFDVSIGLEVVTVKAINACGDEASCNFKVEIKDKKKPVFTVVQDLYANLTGDGKIILNAAIFNLNAADNCSETSKLATSFSQNVTDSIRVFDCDSLGDRSVKIFVTDESGNFLVKTTTLHVWDALGACQNSFVFGKITNENGFGIEGVEVNLTGEINLPTVKTVENGQFLFPKIQNNKSIVITPTKDVNPLNGISTFDLSLMMKHILGQKSLDSPYKIIAADVTHNGIVTTADLGQLRRLILGEISDFSQNDSWRFVRKDFVFEVTSPACGQPFLENAAFNSIGGNISNLDFVAVKIGDLNGDALVNNLTAELSIDDRNADFLLKITDRFVQRGEEIEVPIRADLSRVSGFQTTLNFDANSLKINALDFENGSIFSQKNSSMQHISAGKLPISWLAESTIFEKETTLFTLKLVAETDGFLSQFLTQTDLPTPAEAFDASGAIYDVKLMFEENKVSAEIPTPSLQLAQNAPNPVQTTTKIAFSMPKNGTASLQIFNLTGQEIWQKTAEFVAGTNEIEVNLADLSVPPGIYTYRLNAPTGSLTRKMLLSFR
jgi:Secretion system C-terminal sorting domain/Cohesin domain